MKYIQYLYNVVVIITYFSTSQIDDKKMCNINNKNAIIYCTINTSLNFKLNNLISIIDYINNYTLSSCLMCVRKIFLVIKTP